jgi:two-component system CheB/CheR fusion protein
MPADVDPGMAFVLVQHLAPDHKSLLRELIQRTTRMNVFEVEDGMVVQPNCAYIIPPNYDMAFLNGTLQLLEHTLPRGQRMPIDFLFRSLAMDQRERAIAIVLSGTGSDGSLGVRAIKGEGGMVMVQSTASSEFDGMPRSALETGLVDFELSPAEMPAQLIAYVGHAFSNAPRSVAAASPDNDNSFKKIFILLRTHTGHDFSQYKPSTIYRRIERRMALHQIKTLEDYVKYLHQIPQETQALFSDLLIGVTNYFRDKEAFAVLEAEVIPLLFEKKLQSSTVRVWCAGCSTGEEAYSVAILLQEHLEAIKQNFKVQVFATDIDNRSIVVARNGLYPASIAGDLTPERLARFFSLEADSSSYRIHKSIRDMLVFSEQDVIKDPPFSKLDLVCCRNLLIYLGADLQKKLVSLFHYALQPRSWLFLGPSETVGELTNLFVVHDRKAKIYRRQDDFPGMQRSSLSRFLPLFTPKDSASPTSTRKADKSPKGLMREMTEQILLEQFAPVAAVVNSRGDIHYLHGRSGRYLEPSPGEAGLSNILQMAREGLRHDLTTCLFQALGSGETIHANGLRVKTNDHFTLVNIAICPVLNSSLTTPEVPLYLVTLQDTPDVPAALPGPWTDINPSDTDTDPRITALKQELRAKDEYLLATHEELQSSNEELKSANEEMQSVNEELQSTNEELETSKEELQSINEELSTVNTELQTKVTDLSRANNDMNNLLAGTGIATVFVDHSLRILRFTPAATRIINLIASDVGRPVGHIVSNLQAYDCLITDVQLVLDTLVPKETEVQTLDGKWYVLRILPYRTLDNVIEGAVVTFIDITEVKHTQAALQNAEEMLRSAVLPRDALDAMTVHDLQGRIFAWNPGAVRLYGWTEAEALQMNVRQRIPKDMVDGAVDAVHHISLAKSLDSQQTSRLAKDGRVLAVSVTATPLCNELGQIYAVATLERPM